ncbi:hypothetical protein EIW28_00275 [Glycomyces terrestris]|uniref:Uncharacterized protein n=2 Tax=Glycomyces terrestris TaxID=2493553 RepID=A0A426V323_9ACTN|nr:hypothetical protein EIW28_00275 [Glycomyces terrestris]
MVATAVVFAAAAPDGRWMSVASGLGVGVAVAVVTGGALTSVAHLQARLRSGRTAEQAIAEVAALARPAGGVADRVEAILARDPAREHEVHRIAWEAAGVGRPNRRAAEDALDELWRRADPAAAAERAARLREVEASLQAYRRERER